MQKEVVKQVGMTRGYSLVMSIFLKEVQVHSSIPPLVSGKVRGHLMVGIDGGVEWKHSVGPPAPKLSIRLSWWGQESQAAVFR